MLILNWRSLNVNFSIPSNLFKWHFIYLNLKEFSFIYFSCILGTKYFTNLILYYWFLSDANNIYSRIISCVIECKINNKKFSFVVQLFQATVDIINWLKKNGRRNYI